MFAFCKKRDHSWHSSGTSIHTSLASYAALRALNFLEPYRIDHSSSSLTQSPHLRTISLLRALTTVSGDGPFSLARPCRIHTHAQFWRFLVIGCTL
jgi:hypothetical protein